ncbi:acyl-CoA thioesterase [Coxiella endosymbiont of Rhipicephalus microplus]|uniref:acyl-CoA thioesterase n=1 Tax=Coxiella endosymbiont of Rhipicephalus microplus TaxID=1656186 RepID=UPI000C7FA028|nr:acyl-CoA thioesterase [Coxiella endosymbiont of Rhipicephalus microplus]
MTPEKVNFSGNIHGGYILKLIDQTAYACATRYSRHYVVTLSVDRVLFKQPIYLGELVICYANVNYVGRSSMEIGIKIVAENLTTGERRHTNSCYVTMVAVNKNLKPIEIKPLRINNKIEQRRFEEAKIRRQMRLSLAKSHSIRKNNK